MRIPQLISGACIGAALMLAGEPAQAVSAPNSVAKNPLAPQQLLKFGKRLGPDPDSKADECRASGGQPILLPGAKPEDSICMGNDFVPDNLLFISLHELSHGLVHAYNIPTFAEDEDVSDKFATYIHVIQKDPTRFAHLINSAVFWLQAAKSGQAGTNRAKFWDEHSLEEKRGSEILCHIVGAVRLIQQQLDPNDNEWIRPYRQLGLYPEKNLDWNLRDSCRFRAQKNLIDWDSIALKSSARSPLITQDWHAYSLLAVPDVVYEAASGPKIADLKTRLRETQILETLRAFILDSALLASKQMPSLKILGRQCSPIGHSDPIKFANAYFDSSASEISICYELIGWLDEVEREIRKPVQIGN